MKFRRWIIGILAVSLPLLLGGWLLAADRLDDYCYDTFLDHRCDYLSLGGRDSVSWQDEHGGHTIFWVESVSSDHPSQDQAPPFPVEELPIDFRLRLINTPQEVLDQLPEEVRQDYLDLITAARESLFETYEGLA